jgi:DNA-binding LytR/AlgR family response regulator
MTFRALIAEDEPLLALGLQHALAEAWPELDTSALALDGIAAVQQALALQPDVLFFDIRMPGQSGLEAAAELADAWPPDRPFPALVFITAYDQYAVQAFEAQAADYLLKPVQPERLRRTVQRLQQRLTAPLAPSQMDATLAQLRALLDLPAAAPARLQMLQAGQGTQIHMVAVAEVLFLEAADKYVRVCTATQEYLVRTPLKELLPCLDPEQFWQVHRGTVVRANAIASASRDASGGLSLHLRQRPERLAVSRLYAHRFKAM